MLELLFRGLFDSDTATVITVSDFLLCILFSLALGLLIACFSMYRNRCSRSFILTLALLPAVVCVVIMLVNGNVGTGVAVAGAFSLVRFRSVPGTAREICALFLAMGCRLITGMGYLGFAVIFTLIMCVMTLLYSKLNLGRDRNASRYKPLSITIPEDLDYTDVFADIFSRYTSECELVHVRTTNMGSLFRLTYHITMRERDSEKAMIDSLRCRNGNLEISVSAQETDHMEL